MYYILNVMTDIGKFLSDIQRIKKRDRQNNAGIPDYNRIYKDINNLFLRYAYCSADLARSVFEYWENEYIFSSENQSEEPTTENSNRLAAFLAFLEGSNEFQDLISKNDWKELCDLVNYEAEVLPVDLLQSLMSILVEKGVY